MMLQSRMMMGWLVIQSALDKTKNKPMETTTLKEPSEKTYEP